MFILSLFLFGLIQKVSQVDEPPRTEQTLSCVRLSAGGAAGVASVPGTKSRGRAAGCPGWRPSLGILSPGNFRTEASCQPKLWSVLPSPDPYLLSLCSAAGRVWVGERAGCGSWSPGEGIWISLFPSGHKALNLWAGRILAVFGAFCVRQDPLSEPCAALPNSTFSRVQTKRGVSPGKQTGRVSSEGHWMRGFRL